MDLPYAMTIESAADAVVTFKTKRVYPYHHWGIGCLSDVKKFREKNISDNQNIVELTGIYHNLLRKWAEM